LTRLSEARPLEPTGHVAVSGTDDGVAAGKRRRAIFNSLPVSLPTIRPMRLVQIRQPLDGDDWIFEIKYDGFGAPAYVDNGAAQFVSRNGNVCNGKNGHSLNCAIFGWWSMF